MSSISTPCGESLGTALLELARSFDECSNQAVRDGRGRREPPYASPVILLAAALASQDQPPSMRWRRNSNTTATPPRPSSEPWKGYRLAWPWLRIILSDCIDRNRPRAATVKALELLRRHRSLLRCARFLSVRTMMRSITRATNSPEGDRMPRKKHAYSKEHRRSVRSRAGSIEARTELF